MHQLVCATAMCWSYDSPVNRITQDFRKPYTGSDVVQPSNVPYESDACDDRSLR
jgi:hypothetical protein